MDRTRVTPVAVIGMGCRLPGGIDSPDRLWEALLRGDDLVTEIPADRWDIDEYYDPEPGVPGRTDCKWGAYLDNVGDFDPEFFGIGEERSDSDRSAAPLVAGNLLGSHGARRPNTEPDGLADRGFRGVGSYRLTPTLHANPLVHWREQQRSRLPRYMWKNRSDVQKKFLTLASTRNCLGSHD